MFNVAPKQSETLSKIGLVLAAFLLVASTPGLYSQNARIDKVPSPEAAETLQRGVLAMRAGQPNEAIALFEKLVQSSPRFAEAYLNLGLAYSQEARSMEAISSLEKGIALKPTMRGGNLFLAIADYKIGHFDQAAMAIRKETALDPKASQAWMWQGIIDLALGHLPESVADLDHAAALDPTNVDILYHRGHAALELSRQSYETMFKLDSKNWHVSQVLAEAAVESGNDADAIEQFQAAIASAPPQSGLYEGLGSAYWRSGKYAEAQQSYEKAISVDPNDTVAVYKLGCLRIDRSDAAGGKELLQRVVGDTSLVMTNYYLGRAEIQLGNDKAAIADLELTIGENLDDDTTKQAYFQLSRAYRRLHNQSASEQAQAKYRLLDQKSKDAIQEKLLKHRLRGDRDTSIPAPQLDVNLNSAPVQP